MKVQADISQLSLVLNQATVITIEHSSHDPTA